MTEKDEKNVTISTKELMAMFQMENLRTFVSLYQHLNLVRVDDKQEPLVEALWLREDFHKILKVNKYYNCNMEIVMLNYFGRCI